MRQLNQRNSASIVIIHCNEQATFEFTSRLTSIHLKGPVSFCEVVRSFEKGILSQRMALYEPKDFDEI